MKILHVLQNYHPSMGGTQWLFQNISEGLVKDYGDEVTVFTTNSYYGPQRGQFKKIEETESIVNGVRVVRFPYMRWHFGLMNLLQKLMTRLSIKVPEWFAQNKLGPLSAALTNALKNGDYDVVCASSYFYKFMLYPLYRHKGSKPKPFVFVGTIHFYEKFTQENLMKKTVAAINASEYFVALTSFEKDRAIEHGVKPDIPTVIGCGVNTALFANVDGGNFKKKLGIENKTVIGYFGRHDKIKGIDLALEAFGGLAKKNEEIVMVIAGAKSAYTAELQRIIDGFDENISKRCHIITDLNEKEKAEVYNAFDLLVCPSTHESFGIVFLEAWACKKPVIGASIGAVRSVIDHGVDGYLIEPGNVQELASNMQLLINDPQLRDSMGQNGYKKVMEQYTWPVITSMYRDTYVKAIEAFKVKKQQG